MKEKVDVLIDKLQELKNENAAISELSHYTKLLYAELMCAKNENDKKQSTKKVSVIMPGYDSHRNDDAKQPPVQSIVADEANRKSEEKGTKEVKNNAVEEPTIVAKAVDIAQTVLWEDKQTEAKNVQRSDDRPKELNDLIAEQRISLNDQLKIEREELASRLGNAPVKDLHKAIGLNEKFGFINELFRGDQSLYDRSIKTINECKNLDEALYWIDRELKISLGWQDKNKAVQRFYALIKKRFS